MNVLYCQNDLTKILLDVKIAEFLALGAREVQEELTAGVVLHEEIKVTAGFETSV